jgi:hypothetical protein
VTAGSSFTQHQQGKPGADEGVLGESHRAPPATIPVKVNHRYFSLSRSGLAWEAVLRSRNIAVYAPADFPNPKLELIVLLPEPVTPPAAGGVKSPSRESFGRSHDSEGIWLGF